jgi:hypothetical protein
MNLNLNTRGAPSARPTLPAPAIQMPLSPPHLKSAPLWRQRSAQRMAAVGWLAVGLFEMRSRIMMSCRSLYCSRIHCQDSSASVCGFKRAGFQKAQKAKATEKGNAWGDCA